MRALSAEFLDPVPTQEADWWKRDTKAVGSVAAVLDGVLRLNEEFRRLIIKWLGTGGTSGQNISIQRAALAALNKQHGIAPARILELNMKPFGDKFEIKHRPLKAQER